MSLVVGTKMWLVRRKTEVPSMPQAPVCWTEQKYCHSASAGCDYQFTELENVFKILPFS